MVDQFALTIADSASDLGPGGNGRPAAAHCCMLSTISVRDLRIDAGIGINPEEIGTPQPLVLSVILDVIPPSDDRIGQAFDYANIAVAARALGRRRIALIETFAWELAAACLSHRLVLRADVSVEKPQALVDAMADARVVLSRPSLAGNADGLSAPA